MESAQLSGLRRTILPCPADVPNVIVEERGFYREPSRQQILDSSAGERRECGQLHADSNRSYSAESQPSIHGAIHSPAHGFVSSRYRAIVWRTVA